MDNLKRVETQEKIQPQEQVGGFEVPEPAESAGEDREEIEVGRPEKLPAEVAHLVSKPSVGAPGIDTTDSPLHQSVESVLESDLEDLYFSMTPDQQEKFKKKGETTTTEIVKLIKAGKATFKKVFKLILSWLKFIPGVSKYFIEQDAKIKTDRVINLSS